MQNVLSFFKTGSRSLNENWQPKRLRSGKPGDLPCGPQENPPLSGICCWSEEEAVPHCRTGRTPTVFCVQTPATTLNGKGLKLAGNISTYRHSTGSWGQDTCLFFCFAFVLHPWFSAQLPVGQEKTRYDSVFWSSLKYLTLILTNAVQK